MGRLFAGLGVALLVVSLLLLAAIRLPPVQRWLAAEFAPLLGPEVRAERILPSLRPFGARFDGVRIVGPSGSVPSDVLSVARLRLGMAFLSLFREGFEVDELVVERPRVAIEQAPDGSFPVFDVIADLIGGDSRKTTPAGDEKGSGALLRLPITVRDGEIRIVALGGAPVVMTFDSIDGSVTRAASGAPLKLELDARPGEGRIGFTATYGGRAAPDDFQARVQVVDVPADQLFVEPPGGFAMHRGDLSVRGRVADDVDLLDSLDGEGSVLLSSGRVSADSLGGLLWVALVGLVPGHHDASHARHGAPSEIDHLSSSFVVGQGRIETRDFDFVTDDYTVLGRGDVGLDLSMDLRVRVELTPSGFSKLLATTKLPLPTGPLKTLLPIPLKVTRSVKEPRFRLDWLEVPLVFTEYLLELSKDSGEAVVHGADEAGEAVGMEAVKSGDEVERGAKDLFERSKKKK